MRHETLEQLAGRINSLSVDSRRPSPTWLKRWRARGNATANSPVVTTWGDTLEDAVTALVDRIDKEQAARRPS